MSTAVTAPNLMDNLRTQTRRWLTPLNLHIAGVALLALVNLYLIIHLSIAWSALQSRNQEAIDSQRAQVRAADLAAQPLRGLDAKIAQANDDAEEFYDDRLPYADSTVVAELGRIAKAQSVKLTRVQYTMGPVLDDPSGRLQEVRMDASLSGDYRPLVQFINSLERDKSFFLINGVTLSGQQSGTVGLRLRLTTYLRKPNADETVPGDAAAAEAQPR